MDSTEVKWGGFLGPWYIFVFAKPVMLLCQAKSPESRSVGSILSTLSLPDTCRRGASAIHQFLVWGVAPRATWLASVCPNGAECAV